MSDIVLIEEDALIRSLVTEWLAAEGYHVSGAGRTTGDTPAPTDLVIVDVYMPRDSGVERLRRVRGAYRATHIIAISGQFRRGLAHTGPMAEAFGVDALIAKPFDRKTLLHAVRSIIGPPPENTANARGACVERVTG